MLDSPLMILFDLLRLLCVVEVDFIEELLLGIRHPRRQFVDLLRILHVRLLVLVDAVAKFMNALLVTAQSHLLITHCPLILALECSKFLFEFSYAVS